MTTLLLRLRPLLVGLVALLFTAGIAFAAKPEGPPPGLAVAAEHAGKTVPVQAEEEEDEEETEEEVEEEVEEEEETEDSEDAANCATDPSALTPEELAEVRHGSVVCWAAHQETPEGYDNRGAWVSEWAQKNRGHDFGAEDEAGTVLPEATNGKAKGKSKNH
jgi:hypothetical protein